MNTDTNEVSYDDYLSRINIQELLRDAGYVHYRRDGIRYPTYVRLDSEGRRIRGDKFIVTANGKCCFHPPELKRYNVLSYISVLSYSYSSICRNLNALHALLTR